MWSPNVPVVRMAKNTESAGGACSLTLLRTIGEQPATEHRPGQALALCSLPGASDSVQYLVANHPQQAPSAEQVVFICKVSLLCSALYAKCSFYVVLYMQSALIM